MVVAVDGEIKRDQYRIFKIDDIKEANDPAMLKRVLERRLDKKNIAKYPTTPDIILIDGGKSQLSALLPLLGERIQKSSHLLGISKGKHLKRKGSRQVDEFWLAVNLDDSKNIKKVNITNRAILTDLRDEAHRFAILHHRKARRRDSKVSELDKIPGVGEKRRGLLLKHFKSIENIKKANREQLNEIVKNKKVSETIYKHFNKSNS